MADESETVAGGQTSETPQFTAGQQSGAAPPLTPPPLTGVAEQAAREYVQIAGELAVASPSVTPSELQAECTEGFWCLPNVNCSARDFSPGVQDAFNDNRDNICLATPPTT